MKMTVMILCLLIAAAAWGVTGEQPSIRLGETLFNSTQLGTNGMSCAACHPGGKMLGEAAGYQEDELAGIINQCIKKPLKGNPLATDSAEIKSLIMYIKNLAPAKKP